MPLTQFYSMYTLGVYGKIGIKSKTAIRLLLAHIRLKRQNDNYVFLRETIHITFHLWIVLNGSNENLFHSIFWELNFGRNWTQSFEIFVFWISFRLNRLIDNYQLNQLHLPLRKKKPCFNYIFYGKLRVKFYSYKIKYVK